VSVFFWRTNRSIVVALNTDRRYITDTLDTCRRPWIIAYNIAYTDKFIDIWQIIEELLEDIRPSYQYAHDEP
jgi:glycerol kinase